MSLSSVPLPELIQQLQLGGDDPRSSDAAVEVLRRFQPLLRKYWAWHRIGEYDDYVQEVMVRLFVALPRLKSLEAFPGLFRKIVIGTATDALRSPRPDTASIEDIDEERLTSVFDESLSTSVVVRSYLEHLPPREREVLSMLFFDDMDPDEVAAKLSLTAGTVRMTKSRAIERLRGLLAGEQRKFRPG